MRDLKFKITSWIVITVGTLVFIPGFLPFRTGKIIVVEWMIFSVIALWFIKNIWIRLFLFWCILRTMIGLNPSSLITLHTVIFGVVLFQLLSNKLDKDRINTVLNIICGIAIFQSIMVILQKYGIWFIAYPNDIDISSVRILFPKTFHSIYIFGHQFNNGVVGFLDNPNIASAFIGMCLPAFFRKKQVFFIPLIIIALFFVHSFGGIVACIITSAIFLLVKFGKKGLLFLLPVLLIFSIYCLKNETLSNTLDLSNRKVAWNFYVTEIIPKRPIIGWGLGQERFLWPIIRKEIKPTEPKWLHSHNEPISLTIELGLIGLFLVCGYFFTIFRKLKKENLVIICGLIACIISFSSIFAMHSAIGLLLIFYMAMAERSIYGNKG